MSDKCFAFIIEYCIFCALCCMFLVALYFTIHPRYSDDSINKTNQLICKIDKQIDTVNNLILTCSEIGK